MGQITNTTITKINFWMNSSKRKNSKFIEKMQRPQIKRQVFKIRSKKTRGNIHTIKKRKNLHIRKKEVNTCLKKILEENPSQEGHKLPKSPNNLGQITTNMEATLLWEHNNEKTMEHKLFLSFLSKLPQKKKSSKSSKRIWQKTTTLV